MRAAIYLRVSTDHDEQKLSPEHQLATCKEFAKEIGLEPAPHLVYNDSGLSGTEMEHRLEVQRLVADARLGKFDVVLFTAISRFARDLSDALALKKRLETVYGVRIISVEEGYDSAIEGRNSEMIFTVHAMVAAHKSKEMSKAIRRGLRQSASSGRHIGNIPPYGYIKSLDKRLIPDPQSAPIIKEIFKLYLRGYGSKAISEMLNSRGIPTAKTARGKGNILWHASTVTAILHNPVYVGHLVANKWRNDTDIKRSREFDKKIKRQMQRNENDWVVVEGNHEAIIDEETFCSVQDMMQIKATNKGVKRTTNFLTGLMKCTECGGAMIVSTSKAQRSTYKYVVCAVTRRIGKSVCTNHTKFRYDDVLTAVLRPLQRFSVSKQAIDAIIAQLMQASNNDGITNRMAQIHKQLEHNLQRQKEAVRAFTEGLFSLEIVREHQIDLQEENKRLQDELTKLEAQLTSLGALAGKEDEMREILNVFVHLDSYEPITIRTALSVLVDRIEFTSDKRIKVVYQWDSEGFARLNTSLMS